MTLLLFFHRSMTQLVSQDRMGLPLSTTEPLPLSPPTEVLHSMMFYFPYSVFPLFLSLLVSEVAPPPPLRKNMSSGTWVYSEWIIMSQYNGVFVFFTSTYKNDFFLIISISSLSNLECAIICHKSITT